MNEPAGRACPIAYRYGAQALHSVPEQAADTLYVIGGLYGNLPALDAILEMASREPRPPTLCFNGDFNWFNLETSVGGGKSRSCFDRLSTSGIFSAHPTGELPFALSSPRSGRVEGLSCHQQRFLGSTSMTPDSLPSIRRHRRGRIRLYSHLPARTAPVCERYAIPACHQQRCRRDAELSRQSRRPADAYRHPSPHPALYGAEIAGTYVDALQVDYDQVRWQKHFLGNWPAASPAHLSYFSRITEGPDHHVERARLPAHLPEHCA